jgi:hypothetical protein
MFSIMISCSSGLSLLIASFFLEGCTLLVSRTTDIPLERSSHMEVPVKPRCPILEGPKYLPLLD